MQQTSGQVSDIVVHALVQDVDQVVTPWKATTTGKFNYQRLIEKFGVQPIDEVLIERFERVTGHKVHPWIRRGLFFAHRQISDVLDAYEKGDPIYLYTGRGPTSDALHLGHVVPFIMTKWLQDVFDCMVIVQMADDEKYYFKDMEFNTIYKLGFENAKDILAVGFNPKKTFIFSNRDYSMRPEMHNFVAELMKRIRVKDLQACFGLEDTGCIGQYVWPLSQMAAAFSPVFNSILGDKPIHCLIVYAIDQDPYFRLARDVADRFNCPKPSAVMSQFLPALEGNAKMSSTSGVITTIFMTDDPAEVDQKVRKYAFSGGKDTAAEQRIHGADLEVDMAYQYLRYFLFDDNQLDEIARNYASGKMLTGEIKGIMASTVAKLIAAHQEKRKAITPELIKYAYDLNNFKFSP
jgi:tryptophanyl-tRNA synthetase